MIIYDLVLANLLFSDGTTQVRRHENHPLGVLSVQLFAHNPVALRVHQKGSDLACTLFQSGFIARCRGDEQMF